MKAGAQGRGSCSAGVAARGASVLGSVGGAARFTKAGAGPVRLRRAMMPVREEMIRVRRGERLYGRRANDLRWRCARCNLIFARVRFVAKHKLKESFVLFYSTVYKTETVF